MKSASEFGDKGVPENVQALFRVQDQPDGGYLVDLELACEPDKIEPGCQIIIAKLEEWLTKCPYRAKGDGSPTEVRIYVSREGAKDPVISIRYQDHATEEKATAAQMVGINTAAWIASGGINKVTGANYLGEPIDLMQILRAAEI